MKLILLVTDVGGPVALHTLLSEIPPEIPCPLMVLPSSEVGLLESSAAALRRTVSLPIFMIEQRSRLECGSVYFGTAGMLYRPVRAGATITLEATRVSKEEEYLRRTIENCASALGEELTVVFLSGRGRSAEIPQTCTALERSGSRLVVLHRSETVVFDMGQQVLDHSPSASELTASEVAALLAAAPSSGSVTGKRPVNTPGR